MNTILQVFYSIISATLLSLAIPNEHFLLGCPFFAFIAIIPFYKAIKSCKSYKQAFLCGFIQIITTHLISSFWLAYFKDFAIFTLGASAIATGIMGGIFALALYMPFAKDRYTFKYDSSLEQYALCQKKYKTSSFRTVYFTMVYCLYEWFKSSGFLGYPWGTVSSAMFNFPVLMQLSSITGTYGITFITVLFNCIIAELIDYLFLLEKNITNKLNIRFIIRSYAVIFSFIMIYGIIEYYIPRNPVKTLTTIMVQQNANPWNMTDDTNSILVSQKLTEEKLKELKSDNREAQLIVWSEGCLLQKFPMAIHYYSDFPHEYPLQKFIKDNQIPFLAGGSYVKTIKKNENKSIRRFYNSALMFDKDGNFRDYYAKLHLVPFAELIPGIENPTVKKIMSKVTGISAGWSPGENLTYFDINCTLIGPMEVPYVKNVDVNSDYNPEQITYPKVRIATPICFDDSFTDVMRPLFLNGAELFVNITDDSWSLKKSSEYQHFVISSYRAIEYRTTLVRSANAGYSVIIDPSGRILADEPLFTESSLAFDVPVYKRTYTPYAIFGNWFIIFLAVFFILCFININFSDKVSKFIFKLANKFGI